MEDKVKKLEEELDKVKEELYDIKFSKRKIDSELLELINDIQYGLLDEIENLKSKEEKFEYEIEIDYMKSFLKRIDDYIKEFRKSYQV